MSDTFTTTTTTSWFERLRGALFGLLMGPLLVAVAVVLMFWNEGRAVHRSQDLAEGRGLVVDAPADKILPDNEGRLVHITGEAMTDDTLHDERFAVSAPAVKLARKVEMYQWTEHQKSETKKKLGGSEQTITTYSYEKKWSSQPEDSSRFNKSAEHANPAMRIKSQTWQAATVTLGPYRLSPGLLAEWNDFVDLPVQPVADERAKSGEPEEQATPYDGGFYLGKDPTAPQIGDLRVKYRVVKPALVSIIAEQTGDSFRSYKTSHGRDLGEMLTVGSHDADAMFTHEEQSNTLWTWILRAIGFGVCTLGLAIFMSPLSVLADVVPFIGRVVGFGILLIALVLGAVISLVTIAIAWLFFRPLLAIGLLLAALGLFVLLRRRFRKRPAPDPLLATT